MPTYTKYVCTYAVAVGEVCINSEDVCVNTS